MFQSYKNYFPNWHSRFFSLIVFCVIVLFLKRNLIHQRHKRVVKMSIEYITPAQFLINIRIVHFYTTTFTKISLVLLSRSLQAAIFRSRNERKVVKDRSPQHSSVFFLANIPPTSRWWLTQVISRCSHDLYPLLSHRLTEQNWPAPFPENWTLSLKKNAGETLFG